MSTQAPTSLSRGLLASAALPLGLFGLGLLCAVSQAQTVRTFEGRATALQPKNGASEASVGDVLYIERYRDTLINGRVTRTGTHYFNAAGEPIADRTLDFSKHPWKPDYRLVD